MSTNLKRADLNLLSKTLVVHQGALGDQLLSLPLLHHLSQDHSITYLGRGLGRELIELFMSFKTLDLNQSPKKLKECLKGMDFQKSISIGSIDWLSFDSRIHVTLETWTEHQMPIWQSWGQQITNTVLAPYFINSSNSKPSRLIIAPGSGSLKKNWNLEQYIELSNQLSLKIELTILMGPTECDLGMHSQWNNLNGAGTLSLCPNHLELNTLYQSATHFIGNDSGPAHLASVYNLKGLVFFISSDMKTWEPYGQYLTSLKAPKNVLTALQLFEEKL